MKLIHIADSHLGKTALGKTVPETGANLRETLIYENFLAAIDRIICEDPDVVIHAGDLFDVVKPKTRAYDTAQTAIEMLHDSGIPFIVVAGNHSMPKTRYAPSPYEVLTHQPGIVAAYNFRYERATVGDTTFHLIPNMLRAEDYLTEFRKIEFIPGLNNVLVTHGLAPTIRDKRLQTVAEFEIKEEMLSDQFNYIALGHYHNQMQVGPNARYSGSSEYLTYGEIKDTKGALIVDTEAGRVQHLTLPKTPMWDLGTIAAEGIPRNDLADLILKRIEQCQYQGAMLSVMLDFGNEEIRPVPPEPLAEIREKILDLKIRTRNTITDGQQAAAPQDLQTINYAGEFRKFVGNLPHSQQRKDQIAAKGADTIAQVQAENAGAVE